MRFAPLLLSVFALVPSLACGQTFRLDGADAARGPFAGRLVLGDADASGRRIARLEARFASGGPLHLSGPLSASGGGWEGLLEGQPGAAGRLAGETPEPRTLTLRLEDPGCRGSLQGPSGASRFVGRPAASDAQPQDPLRVAAKPIPSETSATRRQLAGWRDVPGKTTAFATAHNGGRPVVVHLPPDFDPRGPARVVVYLHGHRWDVGPALSQHGVLERVKSEGAARSQTIYVFPQAGPIPFRTWLQPPGESLRGIVRDALGVAATLAGAEELTVTRRVVDAHSGGGLALANAAAAGELDADKVNLIDSAYGTWAQTVGRWAARAPHAPRIESWYTNHSSQEANNREAARLASGRMTIHGVGSANQHNALPARVLGSD